MQCFVIITIIVFDNLRVTADNLLKSLETLMQTKFNPHELEIAGNFYPPLTHQSTRLK